MFRIISFIVAVILLSSCVSSGPDIIRPIPLDSPHAPKSPATLIMPLTLVVVDIDGDNQSTSLLNTNPYEIHLSPGVHRIDFQYFKHWGFGDHSELVKSEVMTIILEAKAGQTYELQYEEPTDKRAAEKIVIGFDAWIDDPDNGRRLSAILFRHYKPPVNTAVVNAPVSTTQTKRQPSTQLAESTTESRSVLSELKAMWKSANREERQSFLNWILIEKSQ